MFDPHTGSIKCSECDQTFSGPAALGSYLRFKHRCSVVTLPPQRVRRYPYRLGEKTQAILKAASGMSHAATARSLCLPGKCGARRVGDWCGKKGKIMQFVDVQLKDRRRKPWKQRHRIVEPATGRYHVHELLLFEHYIRFWGYRCLAR